MGAKIQRSVAYLLTEDEFWVGPDSVQNTGPGRKPELGKKPIYYYSFRQKPPFPAGSVYEGWGASHFAELWYAFAHLNQEHWNWSSAGRKVAEEISSYWVNFARSGNPNSPDLPSWPAFTNTDSKVLPNGDPITVDSVTNINGLKVFDDVYTSVRGKPFATR
jgi:para-nitrobenzyl esterase